MRTCVEEILVNQLIDILDILYKVLKGKNKILCSLEYV